jgi:hypothetical protein
MPDLSAFPITKKWPAQHPDRIQLYSLPQVLEVFLARPAVVRGLNIPPRG